MSSAPARNSHNRPGSFTGARPPYNVSTAETKGGERSEGSGSGDIRGCDVQTGRSDADVNKAGFRWTSALVGLSMFVLIKK